MSDREAEAAVAAEEEVLTTLEETAADADWDDDKPADAESEVEEPEAEAAREPVRGPSPGAARTSTPR